MILYSFYRRDCQPRRYRGVGYLRDLNPAIRMNQMLKSLRKKFEFRRISALRLIPII